MARAVLGRGPGHAQEWWFLPRLPVGSEVRSVGAGGVSADRRTDGPGPETEPGFVVLAGNSLGADPAQTAGDGRRVKGGIVVARPGPEEWSTVRRTV